MELKHILESVLFANGKPLTVKELRAILKDAAEYEPSPETESHKDRSLEEIKTALQELKASYDADTARSFFLQEIGDTYQFASRPEYGPWIKQLFDQYRPQRLSQSALETLSIIAYRQPITRADIEAVRGVQVDAMVQTLMERGLIKIAGRAELPGRPMLYETTQAFLEHFGLKSLDELPNAEELRSIKLKTAEIPTPDAGAGEQELALPEGQSEQPPAPETPEPSEASAEEPHDNDSGDLDTIPGAEDDAANPKTEA
ncbi:SMC-Scp complex subunit ScpB [Oscillatoria laete-virens NRMC-F 0139]|nr:SMC-Scp complex subunit ScpB [Oscillatoria laete-virens]MDL5055228.1 SMC-Scp complex subunit ScpB [Oscillatoria laete-virens NRMC-F 0139]